MRHPPRALDLLLAAGRSFLASLTLLGWDYVAIPPLEAMEDSPAAQSHRQPASRPGRETRAPETRAPETRAPESRAPESRAPESPAG